MIRLLVLSSILVFLTACAGRSVKLPPEPPPNVQALTAETKIEGPHPNSLALVDDPASNVEDATNFGLQAEGALKRCNIDKASLRLLLVPAVPVKCPWYKFGKCESADPLDTASGRR